MISANKLSIFVFFIALFTGCLCGQTPVPPLTFSIASSSFNDTAFNPVRQTQNFTATYTGTPSQLTAKVSQPWVYTDFVCLESDISPCRIGVDGTFVGPGTYNASVTVSGASNGPQVIAIQYTVNPPPAAVPTFGAVVNAASYGQAALVPGELVSIFGVNLGPAQAVAFDFRSASAPVTLGGTRVLFDGVPGPLLYVQNGQINTVVPTNGNPVSSVQVESQGVMSAPINVIAIPSHYAPGIFTLDYSGTGQAVLFNQDGTLNTANNPASRGSTVSFYVEGLAQTSPAFVDGQMVTTAMPVATPADVRVYFDKDPLFPTAPGTVIFAGLVPGAIGVYRVDVVVPQSLTPGVVPLRLNVPVTICIGIPFFCNAGLDSNYVTVAVQ